MASDLLGNPPKPRILILLRTDEPKITNGTDSAPRRTI